MRTTDMIRYLCVLLAVIGLVLPAQAQEDRGWGFSGRFQGSSSSSGAVLKVDPSIDYAFNHYFQVYAGLPVYLVNPSSTATTPTASSDFMNGFGNAYAGIRFAGDNPTVNYASNLWDPLESTCRHASLSIL